MKSIFALLVCVLSFKAYSAPRYTSCISDDQKVMVTLNSQTQDSEMVDVIVKKNKSNGISEVSFPCKEKANENKVLYTLLDSDFELLTVDTQTGDGLLSRGQFGSPNPNINVKCQ